MKDTAGKALNIGSHIDSAFNFLGLKGGSSNGPSGLSAGFFPEFGKKDDALTDDAFALALGILVKDIPSLSRAEAVNRIENVRRIIVEETPAAIRRHDIIERFGQEESQIIEEVPQESKKGGKPRKPIIKKTTVNIRAARTIAHYAMMSDSQIRNAIAFFPTTGDILTRRAEHGRDAIKGIDSYFAGLLGWWPVIITAVILLTATAFIWR